MIEIERKFRLTPEKKASIEEVLQAKYGPIQPTRQIDEVFLYGIDSFDNFKQGMPVVRLRTTDDITTFAYKRRLNGQGDMLEHELIVGSAETMRAVLGEMNYRSVTQVDKVRIEAKAGALALSLDTVNRLGHFLEIELLTEDEKSITYNERQIMDAAAEFGLSDTDLEPRKYDHMMALLEPKKEQ